MNIFKRIFKIGQAEAHSVVDKLEDPIKMIEQGIRDLKSQLDKNLNVLAEVKAMQIGAENKLKESSDKAADYENKAVQLLQKAQKGELDAAEADRLASEALLLKEKLSADADQKKADITKIEANVAKLNSNIEKLKSDIKTYETELSTLKAKAKTAKATKEVNKQMAEIDSTGTTSMIERMKEKVAAEEALSEAYGDIASESKTIDAEIDEAIGDADKAQASDALLKLKEKLGLDK